MVKHRGDEVLGALGLNQGVERMRRSVGVPEREHCVVRVVSIAVNASVHASVAPVRVAPQVRNTKGVVERRCINAFLGRGTARDLRPIQFRLPQRAAASCTALKIPRRSQGCAKVPLRTLAVGSRKANR